MQQIADWLKALGMLQYAKRFAENDIDVSVLPHLTDQDLKELGVSLGHRRKMLAAISELGDASTTPLLPLAAVLLAEVGGDAGRADIGLSDLDELLLENDRTGQRWFDAEAHRWRGELLRRTDQANADDAIAAFGRAIEIAQEQGTKLFELRAVMSLARLWRDQGKRAEARQLLASIYGRFTEGFDTSDLKEANTLLAELD